MNLICDICTEEKAAIINLGVNYCVNCYSDYLNAVARANSPYVVSKEAGRIKTVRFPNSELTMTFIFQPADYLSDEECIRLAVAKKDGVLNGSGKDERSENSSD